MDPLWLKDPPADWPIRSDFKKHQIPGLKKEFEILPSTSNLSQLVALNEEACRISELPEVVTSSAISTEFPSLICHDISKLVVHERYGTWDKLIRVTAKVLKALYIWKKVSPPDQVDLMKLARELWLKSMMQETEIMLKKNKLSGFIVIKKDGLYYATT